MLISYDYLAFCCVRICKLVAAERTR